MIRRIGLTLAFVALLTATPLTSGGCGASIKTNVSPVADVANAGGKIQQTANVMLHAAQQNTTIIKADGTPVIQPFQLDAMALAVNKLGHAGKSLDAALGDYNAAKAAGKDVAKQRIVVGKILGDINDVLNSLGRSIPPGTLQTITEAATSIGNLVMQIKGGVGL